MLAYIALIAFAMFAVLSLVIDFGAVRLTRVLMQNAAESAAVEGLRQRNIDRDGFKADCIRRLYAREFVNWTFADPRGEAQFGAGPEIELSAGVGKLNANQTITGAGVWQPELQLNQTENLPHGDMVSGTFAYTASTPPDETSTYEVAGFARSTTTPGSGGAAALSCLAAAPVDWWNPDSWPDSGSDAIALGTERDSAFLVRLRRTNDFGELDDIESVSSNGPTLPLLFGRASTVKGADPSGGYSVRHHGITVRGAAIAQARPAMRVGLAGEMLVGAAPFAISDTFAAALTAPECVTVDEFGTLRQGSQIVGQFAAVADAASSIVVNAPETIATVGRRAPVPPSTPYTPFAGIPTGTMVLAYGPVFSEVGASQRIVSFVSMGFRTPSPLCGSAPNRIEVSRRLGAPVAPINATAILDDELLIGLTTSELDELLLKNRGSVSAYAALLAPVLSR